MGKTGRAHQLIELQQAAEEQDTSAVVSAPGSAPAVEHDRVPALRAHTVLFLQFWAEGFAFAVTNGCLYGFLLGYLATPGYVYAAADQIVSSPWALQLPFGMLSDAVPIFGRHRRPWLTAGWCVCATASLLLLLVELPPPYWCQGPDGRLVRSRLGADGHMHAAHPCNADARKSSGPFVGLLAACAVGYVMVSAAAVSRTVELHNEDPSSGLMVTTIACRQLGNVSGFIFIAIAMSRYDHNGPFAWGLDMHGVAAVLAAVSACMAALSTRLREEKRARQPGALREYGRRAWRSLCSAAFAGVALQSFAAVTLTHCTTTAVGLVQAYWARMKTVHKHANSIGGNLLLSLLLWLVRHTLQRRNWRVLTALSTTMLQVIDLSVAAVTISGLLRTPFTFTGEVLLSEVPAAVRKVVHQALVAALAAADPGLEGFSQGLLGAAANAGWVTARGAANSLYGHWSPSLSEPSNYIEDRPEFRRAVFSSYLVHCSLSLSSLTLLYLLPRDTAEAQRRQAQWPRRTAFAWVAVIAIGAPYLMGLVMTVLSTIPATMCSTLAGGRGCPVHVDGDKG